MSIIVYISSIDNLVIEHLQSLYSISDLYELKLPQITRLDTTINNVKDLYIISPIACVKNPCFAIATYFVCYSVVSLCVHGNLSTLDAIIQNGCQLTIQ